MISIWSICTKITPIKFPKAKKNFSKRQWKVNMGLEEPSADKKAIIRFMNTKLL